MTEKNAADSSKAAADAKFPLMAPALLLSLALAWGLNWPAMKVALQEMPVWTFRAGTTIVGGGCLLALARLLYPGRTTPPPEEWRGLALTALFNVTAWHMLVAYGLLIVASGHASILAFTMPLWVVVFERVAFGTRISKRNLVALGLGLAGVIVLLSRGYEAVGRAPVGAALVILAAIAWAVGTLIHKRRRTTMPTLAVAGWQLVIGALPMIAVVPIIEGVRWPQASATAWLATGYVTFIALIVGFFAWFQMVKIMPVNVASISSLLVPVVGVIGGAVLLGESFGAREMMALLLIGAALALVLVLPAPPAPEAGPSGSAASADR